MNNALSEMESNLTNLTEKVQKFHPCEKISYKILNDPRRNHQTEYGNYKTRKCDYVGHRQGYLKKGLS